MKTIFTTIILLLSLAGNAQSYSFGLRASAGPSYNLIFSDPAHIAGFSLTAETTINSYFQAYLSTMILPKIGIDEHTFYDEYFDDPSGTDGAEFTTNGQMKARGFTVGSRYYFDTPYENSWVALFGIGYMSREYEYQRIFEDNQPGYLALTGHKFQHGAVELGGGYNFRMSDVLCLNALLKYRTIFGNGFKYGYYIPLGDTQKEMRNFLSFEVNLTVNIEQFFY